MAAVDEPKSVSDDFIAVSVSMLIPSKLCGVSLYTREQSSGTMRLFRGPEFPVTQQTLKTMVSTGRRKLYVSSDEHHHFQQYLRENLNEAMGNESLGVAQRFNTLNVVVRDVLGEAFQNGDINETVLTTQELGQTTVDLLCRDDAVASELCGVLYHDYHTFTHSANVAYYCVMLAKELGITESEQLNAIAAGALLHDLGKLKIADSILTKPGKLTDAEFEIIKQHPADGFRSLCQREDLCRGQLMMVYQHHERLDGGGYPVRCEGNEIHDWARICAVSDVFEALTSNRPYRSGMSFGDAFEIMDRSSGSGFDKGIYECWKQTITNK